MGFWVANTRNGASKCNRLASHCDLLFLHGFQQSGLSFRWRAVDFIRQNDVGKDGARHEGKRPLAFARGLQNLAAPRCLRASDRA